METKVIAQLVDIPLADIEISSTNKIFRDEADFSQQSLQELINSIRENGLAQPILVRPGKKPGKYILVAGERRFRSCGFIQTAFKDRNVYSKNIIELKS